MAAVSFAPSVPIKFSEDEVFIVFAAGLAVELPNIAISHSYST